MQAIRQDQNRYVITKNEVRDITGGRTTLLRRDVELTFHASKSVAHTAAGWLDYIKDAIAAISNDNFENLGIIDMPLSRCMML
jgi:hypothetical protein